MTKNGWFLRMAGGFAKTGSFGGLGKPGTAITIDLGDGVAMELVLIKPGSFMMGSALGASNEYSDDKPIHKVTITKPFYMGKYAVTQEQWEKVMGNNPSNFKGPKNPVEKVSWNDCQEFLKILQTKCEGLDVSLPTEAQWEYACRAGSTTAYSIGNSGSLLSEYAWYSSNAYSQTHAVGGLKPNIWGLYDMHGNVWEWCQDWYDAYTSDEAIDPVGPSSSGSGRVLRGGPWCFYSEICSSSYRFCFDPANCHFNFGLRVVGNPR